MSKNRMGKERRGCEKRSLPPPLLALGDKGTAVTWGEGPTAAPAQGTHWEDTEGGWGKLNWNGRVSKQTKRWWHHLGGRPEQHVPPGLTAGSQALTARRKERRGQLRQKDTLPFSNAKEFCQGKQNPVPILSQYTQRRTVLRERLMRGDKPALCDVFSV